METKKLSRAERIQRWREEKAEKKLLIKGTKKNRAHKIAMVRNSRDRKKQRPNTRQQAFKLITKKRRQDKKLEEEEKREIVRKKCRKRVQRLREKLRAQLREQESREENSCMKTTDEACSPILSSSTFKHWMAKARALKRTGSTLPRTPEKKAEIVANIFSSPRTMNIFAKKGLVNTPEDAKEVTALRALAADISEGVQYLKKSRSNDKRAAYSAFKTVAFGNKASERRAKRHSFQIFIKIAYVT